jgi:hypothetical protein
MCGPTVQTCVYVGVSVCVCLNQREEYTCAAVHTPVAAVDVAASRHADQLARVQREAQTVEPWLQKSQTSSTNQNPITQILALLGGDTCMRTSTH